jgi:hypothetical protein
MRPHPTGVIRLAVAIVMSLPPSPLEAQMVAGPRLQETCATPQEVRQAACAGFIGGVIDARAAEGQFCIDGRLPPPAIVHRVIDYLHSNPQLANLPGSEQVLLALKANWPCVYNNASPPPIRIPIRPFLPFQLWGHDRYGACAHCPPWR